MTGQRITVYDAMPKEFRDALADELVTDIAIRDNGHGYVTKLGAFTDIGYQADKVPLILCLAASSAGIVINDENPSIECSLPNGERLVGKRPEAGVAWTVTIRSPMGRRLTWEEQIAFGTVTEPQSRLLERLVSDGKTIFVVGPMNSGKSTLLNTLLGSSALATKVVVKIEKGVSELISTAMSTTYIVGENCTSGNAQTKSLRESGKVFIFAEARDGEDMDEVMTTAGSGHQSFTTLHADSAADMPYRIEDLLRRNGNSSTREAIHEKIARNVDVCVFIKEVENGKRRVLEIAEFVMEDGRAVPRPLMS